MDNSETNKRPLESDNSDDVETSKSKIRYEISYKFLICSNDSDNASDTPQNVDSENGQDEDSDESEEEGWQTRFKGRNDKNHINFLTMIRRV